MTKLKLIMALLGAVSSVGGIFTDAPECGASVAAAENLKVLAGMLSSGADVSLKGTLHADGVSVASATVYVDGALAVTLPEGFDTSGRKWTLVLDSGETISVAMFVTDDCSDAESWVVDDAEAFYRALVAQVVQ